jgi:hypothetical protein
MPFLKSFFLSGTADELSMLKIRFFFKLSTLI